MNCRLVVTVLTHREWLREHLIILAEALHNAALILSVFPSFNQKQTLHTAKHVTDVTNGHIYVFEHNFNPSPNVIRKPTRGG
jgi:hypothetical protein